MKQILPCIDRSGKGEGLGLRHRELPYSRAYAVIYMELRIWPPISAYFGEIYTAETLRNQYVPL